MIFKPSSVVNNTIKNHNLNVFFNQVSLQRSHATKFLGMQIDENLNWQLHVSHLTRVITVLNGWFFRIRDFIPVQYRRSLYYAYIHSRLSYGISLYGSASACVLKPLQVAQNRCLRTLQFKPLDTRLHVLYNEYNTMPIKRMHKLSWLKTIHTSIHLPETVPHNIREMFLTDHHHAYFTRNSVNNTLFRYFNGNNCKNNYVYDAITIYKNLPTHIKTCSNTSMFMYQCNLYLKY